MKNLVKYCYHKKILTLYIIGFVFLLVSVVIGIMIGSTNIGFNSIFKIFQSEFYSTPEGRILLYVRIPRTLASILCGAALAVSGALIQGVLTNPLASPSIIGVNSGAGLAIVLCTALGIFGGWKLSFFSFIGAFLTVMIVSLGSKRWGASKSTVILIGVALNSLLGAFSDAIITILPDVGVMSNDFKLGDFSSVTYQKLIPSLVIVTIVILILLTLHNELDILTLGEENAKGLGLNVPFMRTLFLIFAALLSGCAVSIAGLLSFVGLLVPHTVRRIAGSKSLHLLGLCAVYGAGFVCMCDTIARTVFSPYEIPVGIILAFLGAPFFVFVLIKRKGGHSYD